MPFYYDLLDKYAVHTGTSYHPPTLCAHNNRPGGSIVFLDINENEIVFKNMIKCEYCGRRNDPASEFCGGCGAPLPDKP
jgi:uncharacterized OB-fold protein